MATYTDIGNMNLERDFGYGTHTWKPPMDRNLKKLAYVMNGSAVSRTTTPPVDAPVGAVYISPVGDPHAGKILISNGGDDWDVVEARNGLTFFIDDEEIVVTRFGSTWGKTSDLGGSVPNDRMNISSFHPGIPGDGYFFFRRITAAAERILAAGPHAAYTAVVAVGGDADLVIAKNGTTIGTVSFPEGDNEGVVTVGADVVLDFGDILTMRTGTYFGIEDFCVTLGGRREYDVT